MPVTRQRRVVLIVEDDHDLRVLLRALLEEEGYEVVTAPQGHAALAELEHIIPDLILADLRMPLMDGWDFVAAIRARADLRGVPIGVHTSEEERQPPEEVSFVIKKPVDARALLAMVRQHLG
jgi:CheY-like chemotaxis protein